jgi:hypothetical protein
MGTIWSWSGNIPSELVVEWEHTNERDFAPMVVEWEHTDERDFAPIVVDWNLR